MRLAVIPARGGSKRIPHKNIKSFCGKPIIAYSIETAIQSNLFDKVIVTTDDAAIAEVAKQFGAGIPFLRPKELSDDFTGTVPVIAHAIKSMQELGFEATEVCCLYATAPFVMVEDLKKGLDLLSKHQADYAFSCTSFPFPIQRAVKLSQENAVSMFSPEFEQTRSQDLEEAYHDAGQFYWGTAEAFCQSKPVFSGNSRAVVLPRYRVQDIDTLEDWDRAEWLFKAMQMK
ncbi:pseudaminic acid cytidylyltransferase [Rodentibacter trehalosifermentans]|uniref:Pseudaminic acid cytidylyltransferase n=1 Tax=Rodentibacter trehalosifermentans TaxID=1908263 RepID=A0A1V3IT82_9PAST|nr:pseudaminic acid cytidylyltransferase [Rodentibacter trehalosifermentans]OOF45498.1 pseudaminic acid cytidylyltransferase [Rodentibacter trehalosifermentans]